MITKIKFFVLLFCTTSILMRPQGSVDMVLPKTVRLIQEQILRGIINNSVNEVTGKAVISVPLASVISRAVTHNVGLVYSGQAAFEIAKNTNKYNPTGVTGVGFDMIVPKIIVDNKNTATREDDEFYLQDGTNNTKLICISKSDEQLSGSEWLKQWEFITEKYSTLKIKYVSNQYYGAYRVDNFIVTTDQGVKYVYGGMLNDGSNSNERVVAWGNWIGDSNLTSGGVGESVVWNLSKIEDQWGNNISFQYNLVQQPMGGTYQTEASYLSKMASSTGEYILFEYLDKLPEEYYEPQNEQIEPDAFQERYLKKYLSGVKSYNSKNGLVSSIELQYKIINHQSGDKKRYLEKIIQKGKQGNAMPPQVFGYYESGDFLGGIKKITYPMGGSVSYSYVKKSLFMNTGNKFDQNIRYDGFDHLSVVTRDNYVLQLLISKASVGDNRYILKIRRHFWNGQKWEVNEHVIPHHIKHTGTVHLENFEPFFMDDAYGYIYKYLENGINRQGRLDTNIFYLKKDGKTWGHYSRIFNHDRIETVLLQGDNFIGIADPEPLYIFYTDEKPKGGVFTIERYGDDWKTSGFDLPFGKYIFGAGNNYISVIRRGELNEYQIAMGFKQDEYYLYYLNSKREWIKKDWTILTRPVIGELVEGVGFMYCNNSSIGLMAKGGPEYILSWDKEYNLLTPFAFGIHHDYNPIINVFSTMLTMQSDWYESPIKSMRFNGQNWSIYELGVSTSTYRTTYGKDCFAFQNHLNSFTNAMVTYNANNSSWNYTYLSNIANGLNGLQLTGINSEFVVAGNKIFKFNNSNVIPTFSQDIPFNNSLTFSDGLSKTFVKLKDYYPSGSGYSEIFRKSLLYYTNKTTGDISNIDFNTKENIPTNVSRFGGYTQFLSPKSIFLKQQRPTDFVPFLYRLIDDKVDNVVYDIVIDKIEINNGVNANNRTISYLYDNFNCSSNNDITYYGKVIIEDKGYGNSSLGTVTKLFNNGSSDMTMAGLLLDQELKDVSGKTLTKLTNTWEKVSRIFNWIPRTNVNLIKSIEKSYKPGSSFEFISNETIYEYSPNNEKYNLLNSITKKNGEGKIEKTELEYVFKNPSYSFMENMNFISDTYQTISKINDKVISVKRNNWTRTIDLNKTYVYSVFTGTSLTNLRSLSSNSKIDDFGHVIETNDGLGYRNEQSASIIYGYDFKYPIASINNAKYDDVIAALDTSLQNIQTLSNATLKTELMKLYSHLPEAAIELSIYDEDGRVIEKIDNRERSTKYFYDEFGRIDYIVDNEDKVIKKHIYNLIQN